jgi:putative phosphoesterase
MKLMIASDLHGSAYYCKKLINAFYAENAERLLFLGDILYHGPRNDLPEKYAPKEVISMLNEIADYIICVRGNCDAEVDDMVLDFPILADYAAIYEEKLNGRMIFATHGHHYNAQNMPKLKTGDILLHGHTHIHGFEFKSGVLVVNPGSVSLPKDGTNHSYLIIEDAKFTLKTLDGDFIEAYEIV